MTLWIALTVAATWGYNASAQIDLSAAPASADMYTGGAVRPSSISSRAVVAGVPTSRFAYQSNDGRLTEPVLVVPAKEVDIETVSRIVEDLTVMGRIIERNSLNAVMPMSRDSAPLLGRIRWGREALGPEVLFSSAGRPKPLYIAGYGVVFFIQVDFPLLPPPEAKDKPQATEQTDTVWAETRQAIFEPQTRGASRDAEAVEPYSREKVNTLRSSLIGVMKHATNIRVLEPGERLTLVVQGLGPQTDNVAQDSAAGLVGGLFAGGPTGRSVLTLRAAKADIDLYAKGELSQAQFEQRMQVTTY